jgi:tetrapyrrole methylase family protein/MazG family protein
MRIDVVGLGPGSAEGIPRGAWALLSSGKRVVLRTQVHPCVLDLQKNGISFTSFDALYEQIDEFAALYNAMAAKLLAMAETEDVVYAVPGHPLVAEQSVQTLVARSEGTSVEVCVGPGHSFLDELWTELHVDPIEGFLLLDATALAEWCLQPRLHTVVAQVFSKEVASEVKLTLMAVYPDGYPVTVVRAAGVPGLTETVVLPLHELDLEARFDHLTTVYLPPTVRADVLLRDPAYAVDLIARLRAPGGCPWDRAQTHESLLPYALEEAYEVMDAVLRDDMANLEAELGDLLMQVLLHAQIAAEAGDFDFRDVTAALSEKLIRRHPHVFGDVPASNAEEALNHWNAVKRAEGDGTEDGSLLANLKFGRPAFEVAEELQKRAASVGFDWQRAEDVLEKVKEEINEFAQECQSGSSDSRMDEFGDILFSLVNVARWYHISFHQALQLANVKFEGRFRKMEQAMRDAGKTWGDYSPEGLNELWKSAKL